MAAFSAFSAFMAKVRTPWQKRREKDTRNSLTPLPQITPEKPIRQKLQKPSPMSRQFSTPSKSTQNDHPHPLRSNPPEHVLEARRQQSQPLLSTVPSHLLQQQYQQHQREIGQSYSFQTGYSIPQLPSLHFGRENETGSVVQKDFSWTYDQEGRVEWERMMAEQQDRLMGDYMEESEQQQREDLRDENEDEMEI